MIEEVKEFFGDVKESVGNNGLIVIGIGAALFFLYNLLKKEDTGEVYYTPSGVTGYPSLEKNADVVIDSVNQTIEGTLMEILGALGETETNISDSINESMEDFNNTQKEGFESLNGFITESMDKMNDLSNKVDNINTTPQIQYVPVKGDSITNITDSVIGTVVNGSTVTGDIVGSAGITDNTSTMTSTNTNSNNVTQPQVADVNVKTSTPVKTETVKKETAKTEPQTETTTEHNFVVQGNYSRYGFYEYNTKTGLNTSTSIVDALKAAGSSGSMEERKLIAAKNGIKNYTGTAAQNKAMLNKLKDGVLVVPKELANTVKG